MRLQAWALALLYLTRTDLPGKGKEGTGITNKYVLSQMFHLFDSDNIIVIVSTRGARTAVPSLQSPHCGPLTAVPSPQCTHQQGNIL